MADSQNIPFKRERGSKESKRIYGAQASLKHRKSGSFNSLQTGKGFQSEANIDLVKSIALFQFPSNGKGVPKTGHIRWSVDEVKFQFPSNGKGVPKMAQIKNAQIHTRFQFPSNGKGVPKANSIWLT